MAKATPIRGLSAHAPLREAAPRILAGRISDVQRCEPGLPAQEAVHDMRVATRRLRAALRLLRRKGEEPPVKKLQDALGAVRDLQLQVEWLKARDPALSARRDALLEKARLGLDGALREWRSRTMPRILEAAEGKFKGTLSSAPVRKLLRKRLGHFEDRIEAALLSPTPSRLHAVRRLAKQLRYLFELVHPAFPALSKALLAELMPLQELLGELHDVDVRLLLLRKKKVLSEQRAAREPLLRAAVAELERFRSRKIVPGARRQL